MRGGLSGHRETTRRFCERWLGKAALCNPNRLDGAFDKFFTLFVAFNRLYLHTAQIAGQHARQSDPGDRAMATQLFPQAIGHEILWQKLVKGRGIADVQTLAELIGPNGPFFVTFSAHRDTPEPEKDADLRRRLLDVSPRIAVEAVLEYLYGVRCNMFHGRKGFQPRQLELLRPCLRCLERIVVAGLGRIDDIGH